jgi:signal transduction histidine kinase/CheY-like chemotaxis protein
MENSEPSQAAGDVCNPSSATIRDLIATHIGDAEDIGIAVFDRDRRHLFFNEKYKIVFDLDDKDVQLGSLLDDVITTSKTADFGRRWHRAVKANIAYAAKRLNAGKKASHSLEIVTPTGRAIRVKNFFTEDHFLLMTVRDISVEKRDASILDIAMDFGRAGYWAYQFDTNKFTFSDSVKNRLSPDELRRIEQTGLWAIMETEDLPLVMKQWGEVIAGSSDLDLTYRVTTQKDGTMWQRSVGKVQYTSAGKRSSLIAFVTDITADVKKNEALVAAEDASRAKSDFLARMSHELKTPLNAIVGMTDALRDEGLNAEALQTVKFIQQSADGLGALLNQGLEHAKLESDNININYYPESPRELIKETCALWRPKSAAKGLELKLDIDDNIPVNVPLDWFRVQQCLNTLLSNAIKFTQKGKIHVSMKFLDNGDKSTLAFIVRDTGVGMTPETSNSIFNAFEQADTSITRSFGGMGLDMSISQKLIKLMGGQISVRSTEGEGTVFAIGLPVRAVAKAQQSKIVRSETGRKKSVDEGAKLSDRGLTIQPELAVENPPLSASRLEGLSVLCVEDNPINQHVVKKLIGKQVSHLAFANNGREALDQLQAHGFDIVLMDIHMPIMDGIEATIEIRNSNTDWANVVIIALTADSDYQQVRICRNLGMNDTIGKPVKRKDILEAFDRVLNEVSHKHGQKLKLSAA